MKWSKFFINPLDTSNSIKIQVCLNCPSPMKWYTGF